MDLKNWQNGVCFKNDSRTGNPFVIKRTGKNKFEYYVNITCGTDKSDATTLYYTSDNIPNCANIKKYTLTADANGGSISATTGWEGRGSKSTKSVVYGKEYGALPTPTKTGFAFDGWYTAASGGTQITSSSTVATNSNHTIYAHWGIKEYTVIANPNGGTLSSTSGWTTSSSGDIVDATKLESAASAAGYSSVYTYYTNDKCPSTTNITATGSANTVYFGVATDLGSQGTGTAACIRHTSSSIFRGTQSEELSHFLSHSIRKIPLRLI